MGAWGFIEGLFRRGLFFITTEYTEYTEKKFRVFRVFRGFKNYFRVPMIRSAAWKASS